MKSVLISIQPKWCELIANGKKTIEVRKTAPKLQTPFKCYIYCTLNGINELFKEWESKVGNYGATQYWKWGNWSERKGKVIGEFVCDRVDKIKPLYEFYREIGYNLNDDQQSETCLTRDELKSYGKRAALYGWHISDFKIYDKPKELSEFYRKLPEKILESGDYDCRKGETICINYPEGGDCCEYCIFGGRVQITRPPQSWCYVEELK